MSLNLDECLKKYKISKDRYDEEYPKLIHLGLTSDQAQKLIFRKGSKKGVEAFVSLVGVNLYAVENLSNLISERQQESYVNSYCWDMETITLYRVSSSSFKSITSLKSQDNLLKLVDKHIESKSLDEPLLLNEKQIERFITQSEDMPETYADWRSMHDKWNVTFDDLLKLLRHDGGSRNCKAFIEALKALPNITLPKGFEVITKEDLLKLLAHDGGSQNCKAFMESLSTLSTIVLPEGFEAITKQDLLKILGQVGGSQNCKAFIDILTILPSLKLPVGFESITKQNLLQLIAHTGGSQNCKAFIESLGTLSNITLPIGFDAITKQDLLKLIGKGGGAQNWNTFKDTLGVLPNIILPKGFEAITKQDLLKLLAQDGGSQNCKTFMEALSTLSTVILPEGFDAITKEDLLKLLAHHGGSQNCKAFMEALNTLVNTILPKGFESITKEDLLRLLARDGGSQSCKVFMEVLNTLSNIILPEGFEPVTKEDLLRLLAHHGGSQNCKAFMEVLKALPNITLPKDFELITKEDLLKLLAHIGGSKNCETFMEVLNKLPNITLPKDFESITKEDLLRLLGRVGGSKNCEIFMEALSTLSNVTLPKGFESITKEELLKLLGNDSGSRNWKAFLNHAQTLMNLGFNRQQIIAIGGRDGGARSLNLIAKSQKQTNLKSLSLVALDKILDLVFSKKEKANMRKEIEQVLQQEEISKEEFQRCTQFLLMINETEDFFTELPRESNHNVLENNIQESGSTLKKRKRKSTDGKPRKSRKKTQSSLDFTQMPEEQIFNILKNSRVTPTIKKAISSCTDLEVLMTLKNRLDFKSLSETMQSIIKDQILTLIEAQGSLITPMEVEPQQNLSGFSRTQNNSGWTPEFFPNHNMRSQPVNLDELSALQNTSGQGK